MDDNLDHDALVSAFQDITGGEPEDAVKYLQAAEWELQYAASAYFTDQDRGAPAAASSASASSSATVAASSAQLAQPAYTGPRTLDGRPAPQSASRPSAAKPAQKKRGIATLGSLTSSGGHGHSNSDDENDEDDGNHGRGDLFAGGEKSGLAVQDPNSDSGGVKKIISDILAKARANASLPEPSGSSATPSSRFRGQGQTLGGDGVPSRIIPDPLAPDDAASPSATPTRGEVQDRTLHLWRDGFSIDGGELRRFDDEANAADLAIIREGRAPLHLMNVRVDEPIDVRVQQHAENWHQLPRTRRPFGGEGRRLGSPLPGVGETVTEQPPTSNQVVPANSGVGVEVDSSQPVVTIRIQLPDGRRVPIRFNTTHRVEHIYEVVGQTAPETRTRNWVLATTFPSKEHIDQSQVLGDMNEFKKGGTAVVKWL